MENSLGHSGHISSALWLLESVENISICRKQKDTTLKGCEHHTGKLRLYPGGGRAGRGLLEWGKGQGQGSLNYHKFKYPKTIGIFSLPGLEV